MTEDEDKPYMPYFMSNTRNSEFGHCNYRYQQPNLEYNNYQNSYRNEQYGNAYRDYNGGYGSDWTGYNQNFQRPCPEFYGCRSHQHPPGPPQDSPDLPSNVSKQDFDSNGPPPKKLMEDKIIKALIRCGVPKEGLKNLPRNLLKRYQPDYCGLCSLSLDNAGTSRMHYICKNHLKNQKKWLSQQTDSSFRRNKEQPLKARELYCEICDVHITSKVHSESHYAGKPHRAIVEGRKNPKNPFLMQRGMEDRLEQLIRREKKHIRPAREDSSEKKEIKAIQPELCCEICDTSVTCTEQMIMHLNGKRHLAKEKQHILRMMKGGAPEPPGFQDKDNTSEQEKESYDQNSEKESFEFNTTPDSWDQMRNNQALSSE